MGSFRPDPDILKKHPNAITQQQIDEKSRFLGTLLGAAAGEALGAPYESKPAAEIGSPPREITGGGVWAAGEPTDDIDLTLALLRSIVACGRLDVEDVARGYLKWFAGSRRTSATSRARRWRTCARATRPRSPAPSPGRTPGRRSAGNGSVMCCAPIGLLHVRNLDGLAEDAAAASRITHYDPRCVAGCVAVTTRSRTWSGAGRTRRKRSIAPQLPPDRSPTTCARSSSVRPRANRPTSAWTATTRASCSTPSSSRSARSPAQPISKKTSSPSSPAAATPTPTPASPAPCSREDRQVEHSRALAL